MAETLPGRYSSGWAKLLSFLPRQVLARQAQIPVISGGSSQQQIDPAIACFRYRLVPKWCAYTLVEGIEVFQRANRRQGRGANLLKG